jgi:hypothetical protein
VSTGVAGAQGGQGGGPGRLRSALLKLLLVATGYVLAVAVATVVTVALLFTPAAMSSGMLAGVRFAVTDAPAIMFVGFFWTFVCALPGFVVAILLGERLAWRRWHGYAFAGLADVFPSFLVFSAYAGSLLGMADLFLSALPGGFAGGAAYWAGAGRFVAARRR